MRTVKKPGQETAAWDLGTLWVRLAVEPYDKLTSRHLQEEGLVASQYIAQTPSTYGFPLLIKGLLESGVTRAPEQEIVSANRNRFTYREFAENNWAFDRQVEMRCKPGRPAPLTQLRIVDGEMNDLPHDGKTSGELVARAPWLTHGYLKDPKGSEKLWAGGWLHTGDVAAIDTDGYVKITDRQKDMIRSGCEWISSLQLEDLILRHPGVAEAAVIGVPEPKWIERPLALLVAKPGQEVSEEQIRAHLQGFVEKGIITSYSVPDRIVFIEALPKTSVGKLDKKVMRERYAQ